MIERDPRPYFTLSNEMPKNAKIRRLTDSAFRLFVELLADCNQYRTDGMVTQHDLNVRGVKAGKELVAAGLVDEVQKGEYVIHDYLKHQKSRKDLSDLSAARSEAASFGNHERHHVKKRIVKAGCIHCPTETGEL